MAKHKKSRGVTLTQEEFDSIKQLCLQRPHISQTNIAAFAKRGIGTVKRIGEATDLDDYRRRTFEEYKKYSKRAEPARRYRRRAEAQKSPIVIVPKAAAPKKAPAEEPQIKESQSDVSLNQLLQDLEQAIIPRSEEAISLRLLKRLDRIAELMEKLIEGRNT